MQGLVPNPITSARAGPGPIRSALPTRRLDPLGSAGGFSGARFWRVESAAGQLCLRCWPREHPTRDRLEQIHRVLRHAHSSGLLFVPACPGQPGKIGRRSRRVSLGADALAPRPGKLPAIAFPGEAAVRDDRTRRFHLATAGSAWRSRTRRVSRTGRAARTAAGPARGGTQRIATAIVPSMWPELTGRAKRWLEYVPDWPESSSPSRISVA